MLGQSRAQTLGTSRHVRPGWLFARKARANVSCDIGNLGIVEVMGKARHCPEFADAVCVRYESRHAPPLRIYFPYRLTKKLTGLSTITRLPPLTTTGTRAFFDRGGGSERGP